MVDEQLTKDAVPEELEEPTTEEPRAEEPSEEIPKPEGHDPFGHTQFVDGDIDAGLDDLVGE